MSPRVGFYLEVLRENPLTVLPGCWQNPVPSGWKSEVPLFLEAVSWGLLSAPRGHSSSFFHNLLHLQTIKSLCFASLCFPLLPPVRGSALLLRTPVIRPTSHLDKLILRLTVLFNITWSPERYVIVFQVLRVRTWLLCGDRPFQKFYLPCYRVGGDKWRLANTKQ